MGKLYKKKNIGTLTSSSTGFINVQSKTFCSQPETGKEFVEYCLVLEQTSWGYIKVLGSQLPLPPPPSFCPTASFCFTFSKNRKKLLEGWYMPRAG